MWRQHTLGGGNSLWRLALLVCIPLVGVLVVTTWHSPEADSGLSPVTGTSSPVSPPVHGHVLDRPSGATPADGLKPLQVAQPPGPKLADRERNAGIDPQTLTSHRLQTARMFLMEVGLASSPRGGYVVTEVDPGSLYAQMGLKPGDRVFSIDTPATSELDDSPDDAMKQHHVELEVYRDSGFVLLTHEL